MARLSPNLRARYPWIDDAGQVAQDLQPDIEPKGTRQWIASQMAALSRGLGTSGNWGDDLGGSFDASTEQTMRDIMIEEQQKQMDAERLARRTDSYAALLKPPAPSKFAVNPYFDTLNNNAVVHITDEMAAAGQPNQYIPWHKGGAGSGSGSGGSKDKESRFLEGIHHVLRKLQNGEPVSQEALANSHYFLSHLTDPTVMRQVDPNNPNIFSEDLIDKHPLLENLIRAYGSDLINMWSADHERLADYITRQREQGIEPDYIPGGTPRGLEPVGPGTGGSTPPVRRGQDPFIENSQQGGQEALPDVQGTQPGPGMPGFQGAIAPDDPGGRTKDGTTRKGIFNPIEDTLDGPNSGLNPGWYDPNLIYREHLEYPAHQQIQPGPGMPGFMNFKDHGDIGTIVGRDDSLIDPRIQRYEGLGEFIENLPAIDSEIRPGNPRPQFGDIGRFIEGLPALDSEIRPGNPGATDTRIERRELPFVPRGTQSDMPSPAFDAGGNPSAQMNDMLLQYERTTGPWNEPFYGGRSIEGSTPYGPPGPAEIIYNENLEARDPIDHSYTIPRVDPELYNQSLPDGYKEIPVQPGPGMPGFGQPEPAPAPAPERQSSLFDRFIDAINPFGEAQAQSAESIEKFGNNLGNLDESGRRRFSLNRASKTVPPNVANQLAEIQEVQKDLDLATRGYFGVDIDANGEIASDDYARFTTFFANWTPWATESKGFYNALERSLEPYLRIKSGAAVPEEELRRYYANYIPGIRDTAESAARKLEKLHGFFDTTEALLKRGYQLEQLPQHPLSPEQEKRYERGEQVMVPVYRFSNGEFVRDSSGDYIIDGYRPYVSVDDILAQDMAGEQRQTESTPQDNSHSTPKGSEPSLKNALDVLRGNR